MINSYNIELYKKNFNLLEEQLLQRKHLCFNRNDTVIDKSPCPSTAKRLLEKDLRIYRPCYEKETDKTYAFFINAKSHIKRKHFYFNDDCTIIDKSPTPSTTDNLFRQDLGQPILNHHKCTHQEYTEKDYAQRKYLPFNEDVKLRDRSQSTVIKMSWTYSAICSQSYDAQCIEKYLLCTFGKNHIERKHLYFNDDETTTDKSPNTCSAVKLFQDDMKNSKFSQSTHTHEDTQGKHFWLDEDRKIINRSSYPTVVKTPPQVIQEDFTSACSSLRFSESFDSNRTDISDELPKMNLKRQIPNATNLIKTSSSDLNSDDRETLDQFTSLKNKKKNIESYTNVKSVPILQLKTKLYITDEAKSEIVNEPICVLRHSDNCLRNYKEDNIYSFHKKSKITNSGCLTVAQNHQSIFPDVQQSPTKDQHKIKDLTNGYSSEFFKLTFQQDPNKPFLIEDEVMLEEEKTCPVVSCQMCTKLPYKHFKQYHPNFPKWKKNTCLALLYLNSAQDKTFKINRCLFCNSMEVNIKHHLCHVHHLLSNTIIYEEMKTRCPVGFLNNTELLIETVLKSFKFYQRSKGLDRKTVNKQDLFLRDILFTLADDYMPEKLFVGSLLTSNMYSLIKILCLQKRSFNKLLKKQLKIFRNFLEFLHFNSDIFAPIDKDCWEQVLLSWNVLELKENQLILVSCKV